jgi:hypothetical protein
MIKRQLKLISPPLDGDKKIIVNKCNTDNIKEQLSLAIYFKRRYPSIN